MTIVKHKDKYLRSFGGGMTEDPMDAHSFTAEEAEMMRQLWGYSCSPHPGSTALHGARPPSFKPGDDMVWVLLNGTWFAADKQALYMGTAKALKAHGVQVELLA